MRPPVTRTLLAAALGAGLAGAAWSAGGAAPIAADRRPPRRKSPAAAFGIAAVPGALIHGAGNYYAGNRRTGALLFLGEIFGLALMSLDHPGQGLDQRIGSRERDTQQGGSLAGLGRLLFFGSWLYDMGSAPDAARRTNRRRAEAGLEFGFAPDPAGPRSSFNPRAAYTVRF